MSIAPPVIGTKADNLTPQEQTTLDRLNDQSIWLREDDVARLCRLRIERLIPYIAARDRADNTTRGLLWSKAGLSRRSGSSNPASLDGVLAAYEKAGLIERIEATKPGRPLFVTLPKVNPKHYRVLPLAVTWTHLWSRGVAGPHTLRYGKDTPRIVRALLVELRSGQWSKGGLVIVNELPQATKARRAGISLRTYQEDWAVLREIDEPWLTVDTKVRPDMGRDAYRVTIDWRLLTELKPAVVAPTPTREVTPLTSLTGGTSRRGTGGTSRRGTGGTSRVGGGVLPADLNKEINPSLTYPSLAVLPSNPCDTDTPQPTTSSNGNGGAGGIEIEINQQATDLNLIVTAKKAAVQKMLETALTTAGGHRSNLPLHGWNQLVIANIVHAGTEHALPLTALTATQLAELLVEHHAAGWDPLAVAEVLTQDLNARVKIPLAVLRTRLANHPARSPIPSSVQDQEVWLPVWLSPTEAEWADQCAMKSGDNYRRQKSTGFLTAAEKSAMGSDDTYHQRTM